MERKKVVLITAGVALICVVAQLYFSYIHQTLWIDEAYSIAMIKKGYTDIWYITAGDVHPPLYYFMLKTYTLLFGNSIFSLRIFSCLAFWGMLLSGYLLIKKLFDSYTGSIFVFISICLPVSWFLATNIRMYSWLALFIFLVSVFAYMAFIKRKPVYYVLLAFFSVCAAYTHNYGLVAAGIIYLLLGIVLIYKRKNLRKYICSVIGFVLLFSFWIPVLYQQIVVVKEDYWIEALKITDIFKFIVYLFSPLQLVDAEMGISLVMRYILLLLLFASISTLFVLGIKKRNFIKNSRPAFLFIAVFVLTILFPLLFSLLIKPIIIPRYMLCVYGPLILGVSILLKQLYISSHSAKTIIYLSAFFIISLSALRFYSERMIFFEEKRELDDIEDFIIKNTTDRTTDILVRPYRLRLNLSALLPEYNYCYYNSEGNRELYNLKPLDLDSKNSLIVFVPVKNENKEFDEVLNDITDRFQSKNIEIVNENKLIFYNKLD